MESYVVPREAPGSETSSVSDIEEDAHRKEKFQQRLYILNRAGSGEAHYLILKQNRKDFLNYHVRTECWNRIKDICSFGVAVVDNYLYILGGFNRKTANHMSRVVRYDPIKDEWVERASMSMARAKFGICVLNGNVYVSGGEKFGGKIIEACEIYDVQTNRWMVCDDLPSPRANHSCVVHGDVIYLAGGYSNNQNHKDMWVFEESTWAELDTNYPTTLPICLDRFSMICMNNTIYFIGGVASKYKDRNKKPRFFTRPNTFSYNCTVSAVNTAEIHDLISPWNLKLPDTHYRRHSAGTVPLDGKIYLFGGSVLESGRHVTTVECFDTESKEWEEDIRIRNGDVSDVVCVKLEYPMPIDASLASYRLKWVMW